MQALGSLSRVWGKVGGETVPDCWSWAVGLPGLVAVGVLCLCSMWGTQ